MSKEYVKKVEALPPAEEMDDVVALFDKITGAYPNAILYGSNIACKAAQGMTLVAVDTDKVNAVKEALMGKLDADDKMNKAAMTEVMLTSMCECVCRENGIDVREFLGNALYALTKAKKIGVL